MDSLAVHARALAGHIDLANHIIGRRARWLSVAMVLVQFIVVVMRYAFGIGSILMQEAIVYMHAVLFMMAAADTNSTALAVVIAVPSSLSLLLLPPSLPRLKGSPCL